MVDSAVRDIQNTQCLLNVEYAGPGCSHVTLQFADSKADVGLGLVKTGLVMVEPRKEKQFQKVVSPGGGPSGGQGEGRGPGKWGWGAAVSEAASLLQITEYLNAQEAAKSARVSEPAVFPLWRGGGSKPCRSGRGFFPGGGHSNGLSPCS